MPTSKLSDVVNQSGFPLQIAIAYAVEQNHKTHNWRVTYTEHAWKDHQTGEDGFIDVVLKKHHGVCTLVVECKRVLDASWIFLWPGVPTNRKQAKAWVTQYNAGVRQNFRWADVTLNPATPQTEYCVVAGQDAKTKPMIERIGSDLVAATRALANEEEPLHKRNRDATSIYFSVLVTTARLSVCSFDPSTISLQDGKIAEKRFDEVPFLRFRKQLSTSSVIHAESDITKDFSSSLARAKEHTVFVVHAAALDDFLESFELDSELRELG